MSRGKKRKPEFGQRGREKVELAEPKPTAMERLKKMGGRWWRASGLRMTKDPQVKGFKRSRLRP
jgi:hypothetical protein